MSKYKDVKMNNEEITILLKKYMDSLPRFEENFSQKPDELYLFAIRCFIQSYPKSIDLDSIIIQVNLGHITIRANLGFIFEYYRSGQILSKEITTYCALTYCLLNKDQQTKFFKMAYENIESHRWCEDQLKPYEYEEVNSILNRISNTSVEYLAEEIREFTNRNIEPRERLEREHKERREQDKK